MKWVLQMVKNDLFQKSLKNWRGKQYNDVFISDYIENCTEHWKLQQKTDGKVPLLIFQGPRNTAYKASNHPFCKRTFESLHQRVFKSFGPSPYPKPLRHWEYSLMKVKSQLFHFLNWILFKLVQIMHRLKFPLKNIVQIQ